MSSALPGLTCGTAGYDFRRSFSMRLRFNVPNPTQSGQNARIECPNRTYREEALSGYLFGSLDEVRKITAEGVERYNEIRPYGALDHPTPSEFAERGLDSEQRSCEILLMT